MRFFRVAFPLPSAMFAAPTAAEDGQPNIDFALRTRVEAIGGQFRPDVPTSDAALYLRANLAVEYDVGPLRIGGEVIDCRVYLDRIGSSISATDVNALEPVQACIKTDFNDQIEGQIGRSALNLGSRL